MKNHNSQENNPITSSIVTLLETGDNTQSIITSTFGSLAKAGVMATLIVGSLLASTSCDSSDDPKKKTEQTKEETPEELTEQQAFKDLLDPANPKLIAAGRVFPSILDGKPVVSIPVSPVPNNKEFTEAFEGFMDIELRLVNAKTGEYSITPIINRNSVEKIIELAVKLEPGRAGYGISLVNQALSSSGVERNLSPGVEISKDDDNNPATIEPNLKILPVRFTMKEFNKFYTSVLFVESFRLSKEEKFNMIMDIAAVGLKFDTVIYPVAPIKQISSFINN